MNERTRVLILGAAGRDFHNFNVYFRDNHEYQVVAFTAAQIPDIANRRYPPELAGMRYPDGIPMIEEPNLEKSITELDADVAVFSYSDVSHQAVMHLACRTVAAGVDFWLLGTEPTQLKSILPVVSVCAVRTGCGKSPVSRLVAAQLRRLGWKPVVIRHPMPYAIWPHKSSSALPNSTTLTKTNAPSRSVRNTSRISALLRWCTPASTTRRYSAVPSRRPTSSSGMAATTTRPF